MATRSPIIVGAAGYRECSLIFLVEVDSPLGRQLTLPEYTEIGFC
jgi:hypothetical protein